MPGKMWDEITYLFTNLNSCAVEVSVKGVSKRGPRKNSLRIRNMICQNPPPFVVGTLFIPIALQPMASTSETSVLHWCQLVTQKVFFHINFGAWKQLHLGIMGTFYHSNFWYRITDIMTSQLSLQWRHNERDGVSNHQPCDCLHNRLFRRRSKKTSKLRVTGICMGNSPVTGEFTAQKASHAENVSIWWRHHGDKGQQECRRQATTSHDSSKCVRYHMVSPGHIFMYRSSQCRY